MSIHSVKEYFHFFDESIEKQTSIKIQEYYEGIKKRIHLFDSEHLFG